MKYNFEIKIKDTPRLRNDIISCVNNNTINESKYEQLLSDFDKLITDCVSATIIGYERDKLDIYLKYPRKKIDKSTKNT